MISSEYSQLTCMEILAGKATLPFLFWLQSQSESTLNPVALRKAKIVCNFGLSECKRVKRKNFASIAADSFL